MNTLENPVIRENTTAVLLGLKSDGDGDKLNAIERAALTEAEQKIDAAKLIITDRFRIIGDALKNIRDQRLYREKFDSFEDYVWTRWTISRARAYQFIDSVNLDEFVYKVVDIKNEKMAREIGKVDRPTQRKVAKVLAKIAPSQPITGETAKRVVDHLKRGPRGGLAAVAQQVKAELSAEKKSIPIKTMDENERARTKINDWWASNRQRLLEYPATPTDKIVEQIIGLFA